MSITALIRVDSSVRLGTGHLMRCLALAEELRRNGVTLTFVCRDLPGNMASLAADHGFAVRMLAHDDPRDDTESLLPDWVRDAADTTAQCAGRVVDWLIVDHYGLDAKWERAVRSATRDLLAIDDLANRSHACDVLLDQNYFADAGTRYAGLLPPHAKTLLGPSFALLRPEFETFRDAAARRDGSVSHVLVLFGGTDPGNATEKAIHAVQRLSGHSLTLDVVVGGSNPNRDRIQAMCAADSRFHYHCQAENIAELMARADLALGAGGATTWERCFVGLPAIVVATALNQVRTSIDLASVGVCWYLGRAEDVSENAMQEALVRALESPAELRAMSARAMRVTGDDAELPTRRLARLMLEQSRLDSGSAKHAASARK
jgi:UDP-2,4-diacetamido-2,4,6-trideoxy-beta-L-altropyranose hydrolase